MIQLRSSVVTAAIVLAVGTACASEPTAPPVLNALPREFTAAEHAVAGAGNAFSFNLFRRLVSAQAGENIFISPLSASMALGMTMTGAAGQTYDEMRGTLGFAGQSDQAIKEGYQGLIALLRGVDPTTDFRIANSIWWRPEYPVEQAFIADARTYFDAEAAELDFGSPTAVQRINDWTSLSTNGKIPEMMKSIPGNAVMILVNAIYFKGTWRFAFRPELTHNAPFHGADGALRTIRLMEQDRELPFLETPEFQAVDLPYGNTAFSMTVIVPRRGVDINEFANSIDESRWAGWMEQFSSEPVHLLLPKMRLEYERILNDDLIHLGMVAPFGAADFSRISRAYGVAISEVKQKTFVDIYEEGTEAAAATSVTLARSGTLSTEMRVDRPFIFAIRERFSGTLLFMGRIVQLG